MSQLERIVRLEDWREQVEQKITKTLEGNQWLVRAVVILAFGGVLAAAKIRHAP